MSLWSDDAEALNAVRFWILAFCGIVFCVFLGKLAVENAGPWFLALCLSLGAFVLTFYSPKIGLGILIFSMLLSPRLRGPSIGGGNSAMGSAVEIRLDDMLLAIVFCAWLGRTAILKRGAFFVKTPVHVPIILYTAACVLSTSLGVLRGGLEPLRPFFFILKYFEFYLLYFMAVNIVEGREDIQRYLRLGWIVAIIVTLYGYSQIPAGQRVSTPLETPISMLTFRTHSQAENEANTYGGYCLVIFGVLLAGFMQGDPKSSKWCLATFVFMLAPFFMTLSRSSYVGLTLLTLFLLLTASKRRFQLFFYLVGAVFIFLMIPSIREPVVNRVLYTFIPQRNAGTMVSVGGAGESVTLEPSAGARISNTRNIFYERFPKHPFFGAGVTGVGLVDTQFPRVLGETGLVGLFAFLWILYRVARISWAVSRANDDPLARSLSLGLLASLIALCFQSTGANTFIIVRIMEPFWFIAAMVARLYIDKQEYPSSEERLWNR